MADYINKADYKKKAKCLFVREEPGVYSFFNKRVIIIEQLNRLKIRTGGGFLSLDEYIELHNPWEQSKRLMN